MLDREVDLAGQTAAGSSEAVVRRFDEDAAGRRTAPLSIIGRTFSRTW
ncbi:hypothetical protein [Streptomyces sp. NPDC005209]